MAKKEEVKKGLYTAKIKEAKIEYSLPDDKKYMDVSFDILLDGKVVADRRLAFKIGTTKDEITTEIKNYCVMYQNDLESVAEATERSEKEKEAEKTLLSLKDQEV